MPTVWQMLLQHLRLHGRRSSPALKKVVIGGSAVSRGDRPRRFHDDYGVDVIHAWGMTETSPLGTLGDARTPEIAALPFEEQMPLASMKQGRPPVGVVAQAHR